MIKTILIIIIGLYLLAVFMLGLIAIIINKKSLVKMSVVGQLLFFILQPLIFIREFKRIKK